MEFWHKSFDYQICHFINQKKVTMLLTVKKFESFGESESFVA